MHKVTGNVYKTNMANFKPNAAASLVIDGMSAGIENGVIENYLMSTYSFSLDNLTIKKDKLDSFIDEIKEYAYIKVQNEDFYTDSIFDYNNNNTLRIVEYIEGNVGYYININTVSADIMLCSCFTKSIQIADIIFAIYKKYEHSMSEVTININTISIQGNTLNYKTNTVVKTANDFGNISKLYYPFLDTEEMFKQYLMSKDKLLILCGEPGTGKTKIIDLFLSHCIANVLTLGFDEDEVENGASINVAYIKNTDILSTDQLWAHLNQAQYNLVILDDIDNMLTERNMVATSAEDTTRKKFITQFLSFSDGIFDKKTKFIITTNQDIGTVDKAIMRKGRCFDILTFRKLKKEEALNIWLEQELKVEDFEKEFSQSEEELLACDIGSKINIYKNNKSGVKLKRYVLEDNISIIHKTNNKKIKIGGGK